MATQHCNTCGEDKSPDDFYESSPKKCKACVLARQKEMKAKRGGGTSTSTSTSTKKTTGGGRKKARGAPPPAADSAWSRPAGLGFSVQLEVDENTKQTDIRVDQWNATAGDTQRIWLNQSEARELHSWLSSQLGI